MPLAIPEETGLAPGRMVYSNAGPVPVYQGTPQSGLLGDRNYQTPLARLAAAAAAFRAPSMPDPGRPQVATPGPQPYPQLHPRDIAPFRAALERAIRRRLAQPPLMP